MGIDTKLYLDKKWGLDDIRDAIASRFELEAPITFSGTNWLSYAVMNVHIKGARYPRRISCHFGLREMPNMGGILLTLSCNDEAQMILGTLGKALGGIYQPNDTTEEYDILNGMLWDGDGIAYFLRRAVIENKLKDNDDMKGLANFIKEWEEKHRRPTNGTR